MIATNVKRQCTTLGKLSHATDMFREGVGCSGTGPKAGIGVGGHTGMAGGQASSPG